MMKIPLVDLDAQWEQVGDDVAEAVDQVFDSHRYIGGPAVEGFEESWAQFVGARRCVGVASGTAALELALKAHGIGPGDRVVVPALTFAATAEAVVNVGAEPVFVDVRMVNGLIDLISLESVARLCDAVVVVHLWGQVVGMERVEEIAREHGLVVIEDAAQAHGARYAEGGRVGSKGTCCWSFYPGKNLGAAGDAGAVTTDDTFVAQRIAQLRDHGRSSKFRHERIGTNARLDAVQAAVLGAKLKHLEAWVEARNAAAERYLVLLTQALEEHDSSEWLSPPSPMVLDERFACHVFPVRVSRYRDDVLYRLRNAGIGASVHYPTPVPLLHAFERPRPPEEGARVMWRGAEYWSAVQISLPLYPEITQEQQHAVVSQLVEAAEYVHL